MEFKNVSVVKKANVYFDGKVSSRTVNFEDGTHKTLGFMLAGEYNFNTNEQELMEILGGSMKVKLPGESEFKLVEANESFTVPAHSNFECVVESFADYCCSYIK